MLEFVEALNAIESHVWSVLVILAFFAGIVLFAIILAITDNFRG